MTPLGDFPAGWCLDTSIVLRALLADRGEQGFKIIIGSRGEHHEKSHVWLKRDDLIIDITADQFVNEIHDAVMITTDGSWHDTWDQRIADLELSSSGIEHSLYLAIANHPDWQVTVPDSSI